MKLKDFKLSTLISGFLGWHWLMAGHLHHQWKILLCNLWPGRVNTSSVWFVTPQHLKEEQKRKVTHLGREPFRLRARTGNNLHVPILASVYDSGCEAGHDNMGVSEPIGALTPVWGLGTVFRRFPHGSLSFEKASKATRPSSRPAACVLTGFEVCSAAVSQSLRSQCDQNSPE